MFCKTINGFLLLGEYMKNLERLVAIKSDNNCDEILNFIVEELKNKVTEIKIFGNDVKVLLAGINCCLKDVEPIILSGHIDTVTANEQLYKTNPFTLTQINGNAYGLGSIDMKSFTAIILDKIEEIKNIKVPVMLALTTDEETELKSIELGIETLKNLNIKPRFTILGEPTNSQFNLCSNACYSYIAKFYGKACHSSRISEGVNAICAMAKLVNFIEDNQKRYKLTSNCGVVKGGEVDNKVPDYAELSFDVRSTQPQDVKNFLLDIDNFLQKLKENYVSLSVKIEKLLAIPAYNMLNNKKINKIADELGIKIDMFSGGCEAGYYTSYSGDAIIYGVGDLSLAHKPNEYVNIFEYNEYSDKLIAVLKSIEKYYYSK